MSEHDEEIAHDEPMLHRPPTDVTTRQAKQSARRAAESARVQGEAGREQGKATGARRPEPGQDVHAGEAVHDENTDRDMDDLYRTEGENEVLEWKRHSTLDAPPARPGYVQRFIRVRLGEARDMARWRAAQREGWRPVKASSVADRSLPTTTLDGGAEVIGVEDLVLCEMPERVFEQRTRFYRNKLRDQNSAIERQLREQVVGGSGFGPIEQTRHSSVSVRSPGRSRPDVAGDD